MYWWCCRCWSDGDSDNDEDAPPGGASWFGEVPSRSTWHPLCFGTGANDDVVDNAVDDEVDVVDDVLDDATNDVVDDVMWWCVMMWYMNDRWKFAFQFNTVYKDEQGKVVDTR